MQTRLGEKEINPNNSRVSAASEKLKNSEVNVNWTSVRYRPDCDLHVYKTKKKTTEMTTELSSHLTGKSSVANGTVTFLYLMGLPALPGWSTFFSHGQTDL